ncbi:ABC transporter permease [Chitinophaga ginsengisegetis]|uniref:ABC transporter permease n=1 Tax=Chitinophaga ginsengisegetis TaxID=393003 RepID=UPI000DB9E716|nr:ABC transporter permease [Chitinophaga ginsengisegetis]MDR6570691.1 ABC-type antimicrobial peptide transport system permease subunit [Chitinophaga ginsengisegetis]MDR6650425.1 ABC-type antimicrobial peptide transport system permease subunit [Chitinophaga ginsengisegetis]MDR6656936.1 ABC-type antimicrobial peptide transport system permease subunit [Chitinophaga ginsengisegetis]
MIRNFFKVVCRNLWRNKGFSAINITGLAVGMAAAILILLWIQDERSYDGFHANKDRIYEVWNRVPIDGELSYWNTVSALTARVVEKDLPEVERAVRVGSNNAFLLSVGDKKLIKSGILVDTGFFQMFSFPMLKGDPATALNDVHSVVLTERTAKSLFGNEDAMGKIIKIENKDNFTVTGILKDLPGNTRFDFEYLLPWSYLKYRDGEDYGWNDNSTPTYVMLKPNVSYASAAAKIKELKQHYSDEAKTMKWEMFIYPLDRWRLYSSFSNGGEDNGGRSTFVKIFGIIAGLILLIACINFMNLSTARSEKRAKEVGIRKVVGAQKSSLISQFIGESVFIAFLAGMVAILIVQLSLPAYNQLTDKKLFLDFSNVYTWMAFIGFILFTGLLAGSYPAFFLSSFQPVKVLKGTFKKANALVTPRKVLVVLQFTFATVLIICTIIVKQQIDYARERETGYNKDNLVYHFMTGDISKNYALIKNELLESGVAKSVTKTNSPLTERWSNGWGQKWEGKDPNDKTSFDRYLADEGLGATAGLQFIEGRDFDLKKYPTDSSALIVNESSLKVMKFKDPIGKVVSDLGVDWHIVGVIKDFILTSPYEPTRPILICGAKSSFMTFKVVQIKLNGDYATAKNLEKMESIFKKYNPDYPFEYKFIDEAYARKFDNEQRQGTLAALFAGLTIFISCLGLFGLATYMAESRIKEVGVRKVLGASVAGITALLAKDFVKLVIISFVIAAPLSYWTMYKWLQYYEYRVVIHWWVFAVACILSVVIAVATVSYQAIKAALINPVISLRKE